MYNVKEKIKIIEEFKNSGTKIKDFAPTWNISVVTLRKWIKQYESGGEESLKSVWEKNK